MNPYLLGAAALALIAAYGAGRHDGSRIQQATQAKAEQVAQLQADKTTAAVTDAIKALRPVFTTINQPLEKEFRSEVRYTGADCSHTDGAWGLLDRAYQAAGGQPFSGGAGVPAAPASP